MLMIDPMESKAAEALVSQLCRQGVRACCDRQCAVECRVETGPLGPVGSPASRPVQSLQCGWIVQWCQKHQLLQRSHKIWSDQGRCCEVIPPVNHSVNDQFNTLSQRFQQGFKPALQQIRKGCVSLEVVIAVLD